MADILIRSYAENTPIIEFVNHKIININITNNINICVSVSLSLPPSKIYHLILLGKVLLFIVINGCEQKNSPLLLVGTPLRIGN